MRRRLVPVVLWSALSAAAVRAQTPGPVGPPARGAALSGLRSGAQVRVATGGRYLQGPLGVVTEGDQVTIFAGGSTIALALAAVDTLWVRSGHAGRGAKVGAVAGGVALVALGASVCGAFGCDAGDTVQMLGLGAVVGSAGGALLGAIVGGVVRRWERRYP